MYPAVHYFLSRAQCGLKTYATYDFDRRRTGIEFHTLFVYLAYKFVRSRRKPRMQFIFVIMYFFRSTFYGANGRVWSSSTHWETFISFFFRETDYGYFVKYYLWLIKIDVRHCNNIELPIHQSSVDIFCT